ncbi:MAG: protein kinase [Butyrivibrio sp.]|nr:protein kinase [Butyrivibrio sp.]
MDTERFDIKGTESVLENIYNKKYTFIKKIGEGGTSKVFLVEDARGNKYAYKLYKKRNEETKKLFDDEILKLNRTDHDGIPKLIEVVEDIEGMAIVMEYVEGQSLQSIIDKGFDFSEKKAVKYMLQLCDILIYLHTKDNPMIYRDLKPANIIIDKTGKVKLIDLGAARFFKTENSANVMKDDYGNPIQDTVCLGTVGYAAPEQYGGLGQTTPQTDIYCIGVILYQLLTGINPSKPPYEINSILEYNPTFSPELDKIIRKSTKPLLQERFADVASLKEGLLNYEILDRKRKIKNSIKIVSYTAALVTAFLFLLAGFFYNTDIEKLAEYNFERAACELENCYREIASHHQVVIEENHNILYQELLEISENNRSEIISLKLKYLKIYFEKMSDYILELNDANSIKDLLSKNRNLQAIIISLILFKGTTLLKSILGIEELTVQEMDKLGYRIRRRSRKVLELVRKNIQREDSRKELEIEVLKTEMKQRKVKNVTERDDFEMIKDIVITYDSVNFH